MDEYERRARRSDALRVMGALNRNLDESGIERLANMLHYLPMQLANDLRALYDFVTEYADAENENDE